MTQDHGPVEDESEFRARYPRYASTSVIDELRQTEFAHLDQRGQIYLDYTGACLAAPSLVDAHAARLREGCYGNPHSENPSSAASGELIESARRAVLRFFHASPEEYAVVFTPNATGACRLVGEGYAFGPDAELLLTFDNHNSVNGVREYARARGARTRHVPVEPRDLRINGETLRAAMAENTGRSLFAFPAQSNFSGVQHSLRWIEVAQSYGYDVLLDAAAFVPSNRLDLSVVRPEFVAVSWYKVFGYPTGVGCLVARRDALARLKRPWFSGGTILAVSVQADWHELIDDETAFEDGTLNFLSIPEVEHGLDWLAGVGLDVISTRVRCLTGWLLDRLTSLHHSDGSPMVRLYGPADLYARGATVAFNLLDPDGSIVDERLVAKESSAAGFSLRTGCFCNPGAGENGFGITEAMLADAQSWGTRSVDEYLRLIGLPTGGAVRASFGLASTFSDAERLAQFLEKTYRDRPVDPTGLAPRLRC
jgi:selenocysteine lyase/cysteine desulfurase